MDILSIPGYVLKPMLIVLLKQEGLKSIQGLRSCKKLNNIYLEIINESTIRPCDSLKIENKTSHAKLYCSDCNYLWCKDCISLIGKLNCSVCEKEFGPCCDFSGYEKHYCSKCYKGFVYFKI